MKVSVIAQVSVDSGNSFSVLVLSWLQLTLKHIYIDVRRRSTGQSRGTSFGGNASRSAWSEYSSAIPQSSVPSDQTARHTDAGVLVPLARSESGRLPPAYRSWEHGSTAGSEGLEAVMSSDESVPSMASEAQALVDQRSPLAPLRFEEKP